MRLEILWTCAFGESFLVAVVVVVIVIVVVVVVVVSRLPLQDFQSQSSNLKFCSLISRDGNHKTSGAYVLFRVTKRRSLTKHQIIPIFLSPVSFSFSWNLSTLFKN